MAIVPNSMTRRFAILLSGGSHMVSQAISTAITFLTIPIIINYLGREAFGIWMIVLSFLSLIGFMQGGVSGALVNSVAKSKDSLEDFSKNLSSALTLTGLMAIIIAIIAILLALTVPWTHVFSAKGIVSPQELSLLVLILCSSAGFSLIALVPKFTLIGSMRAYWAHSIDIAATLLSGGLVVAAALTQQPMWVLALAFAFGRQIPLLVLGILFLIFNFKLKLKDVFRPRLDKAMVRILLGSGGYLTVVQAAYALGNHTDLTLIGIYANLSEAADYALTQKLFAIPILLMSFINLALWPAFAKAKAEGDTKWAIRVFTRNIVLTSFFAAIFATIMGFTLNGVLKLWVNQPSEIGHLLIIGMAIHVMIAVPISNVNNLLMGFGRFKFLAVLSILMVVVNVPASMILITKFGAAGAVFGTIVANVIFIIIPYIIFVPKIIRETLSES